MNAERDRSRAQRALGALRRVERSVLVLLFGLMVSLFFAGVVAREVGGELAGQLSWVEEAVRLLNLFLVFLALGLALERGKHVGIDLLRDRVPVMLRRALERLIDLVGLVFCAYLALLGIELVRFVLATNQTSPTLGIPMGLVYLAPVFGFALLGLRYGLSLFGVIDRFGGDERELAATDRDTLPPC